MILVLGGTSDARALAGELESAGYAVLLSTVSDYGARLAAPAGAAVRSGALDEDELTRLVLGADAVVDATHPFAERISAAAVAACARERRPYLRVRRPAADLTAAAMRAADAAEAARLAVELVTAGSPADGPAGAILLTVGSRTVGVYARAAHAAGVRVVARVLPTPESLEACAAAGLEPRDIVAMQGPAGAELDAALLRHLGATVLVTKESGDAGGLGAKLRAAELAGAAAVVVERPADPGAAAGGGEEIRVATTAAEALVWLSGLSGVARHAESAATPGRDTGPAASAAPEVATPTAAPDVVVDPVAPDAAAPPPAAARRRLPRGLLQVYTGDGKGKTTAAAGQALRARGAGLAVVFVQFVKGGPESSELVPLRAAGARVVRPAVRRSGLLRGAPTPEDRAAAAAAWAAARAALADETGDLVVLDELHAALRHGLVEQDEVLAALAARPPRQEVVTTGRGAPEALLAAADLVTEMRPVRHPYPDVPARRGVEL